MLDEDAANDNAEPELMRRKFFILFLAATVVYCLGYGAARSRKFIVMKVYNLKDERVLVKEIGPGWDIRHDWRGRLKNKINPVVFYCFAPLCALEDYLRGFRQPL